METFSMRVSMRHKMATVLPILDTIIFWCHRIWCCFQAVGVELPQSPSADMVWSPSRQESQPSGNLAVREL